MLEVPARFKLVSRTVTDANHNVLKEVSNAVTGTLRALNSPEAGSLGMTEVAHPECLAQIDRLVGSSSLQGSEALCKLLQYLAHHTLNSPANHLKEYQIATQVLGRPTDFDPQSDSCVRVQVGRLRTKLTEYYNSAGALDSILVDLPKGRYALSFERRITASEAAPLPVVETPSAAAPLKLRWKLAATGSLLLIIGLCVALWMQNRALKRQLAPWSYSPSISALWSGLLSSNLQTDIITEDDAFLLVQNISHETFGFNDYLNHTYIGQMQAQNFSPEIHDALHLIALKNLGRATEVRMAQRILALDPIGNHFALYNAREYMPSLLTQDNVVLLGGPLSNPWVQLFENKLNFTEAPYSDHVSPVTNHSPVKGEQAVYIPTESVSYCVVASLPNPGHRGKILLIQGTSSESTEAGLDFILSEEQLSGLLNRFNTKQFPYFEVLLKTSQVTATPLTTTIEASRTYPDLR